MLIAYASRTGTKRNLAALRAARWRLLVSATGVHRTEGFEEYALDNGAWTNYAKGEPFDEAKFIQLLRKLGRGADWTVLPDIVAGGPASLDLSLRWMRRVLDETPRCLIAAQDGLVAADLAPFIGPRVGIFVGGSTEWKLKTISEWCALGRDKSAWVHVGRVNSKQRINLCADHGATSFDGSSASKYALSLPLLDAARRQGNLFDRTEAA